MLEHRGQNRVVGGSDESYLWRARGLWCERSCDIGICDVYQPRLTFALTRALPFRIAYSIGSVTTGLEIASVVLNYVGAATIDVVQQPRVVSHHVRPPLVDPHPGYDRIVHAQITRLQLGRIYRFHFHADPLQGVRKVIPRAFDESDLQRLGYFYIHNLRIGAGGTIEEARLDVRVRDGLITLAELFSANHRDRVYDLPRFAVGPSQFYLEAQHGSLIFPLQVERRGWRFDLPALRCFEPDGPGASLLCVVDHRNVYRSFLPLRRERIDQKLRRHGHRNTRRNLHVASNLAKRTIQRAVLCGLRDSNCFSRAFELNERKNLRRRNRLDAGESNPV